MGRPELTRDWISLHPDRTVRSDGSRVAVHTLSQVRRRVHAIVRWNSVTCAASGLRSAAGPARCAVHGWRHVPLSAGSAPMAINGTTGSQRRIVTGSRAVRACQHTHAWNVRKDDCRREMIDVPNVVQTGGHGVALVTRNRTSQQVACLEVSPVRADCLHPLVSAAEQICRRSGAGRVSMAVGAPKGSGAQVHHSVRVACGHQPTLRKAGLMTSGTSIVDMA